MGLEQKNLAGTGSGQAAQGLRLNSFLPVAVNQGFLRPIQGLTGLIESAPDDPDREPATTRIASIGAYSAAAASEAFELAADIMKSEMRGTISDLKRDPLKTP
jgi:hypothetical protein